MQHILEEYGTVIGLLLLVNAVIILLSSPEDIFLNVGIIDTNLHHKTPDEVHVYSAFNFYDRTILNEFPENLCSWNGVQYGSDEKRAMEAFKTDTVLLRKYYNGSRSVQFVLIKSENETVLHRPEVCYRANKWNVTKKGTENITPVNWSGEMYVNKIYVQKGNAKEVVMYWYMWGSGLQRNVKNSVVVMISAPVYYNDPDETNAVNTLRDFASEIVPVMYKQKEKSGIIGKQLIDKFGIFGVIIEVLIIGLSLVLIFYNKLWRK